MKITYPWHASEALRCGKLLNCEKCPKEKKERRKERKKERKRERERKERKNPNSILPILSERKLRKKYACIKQIELQKRILSDILAVC